MHYFSENSYNRYLRLNWLVEMWFRGSSIFDRERERNSEQTRYTCAPQKKIAKRWYQSHEMATLIDNIGKECSRSRGSSKWTKRFALAILYGQFLDEGFHCRLLFWRSWKENSFSSVLFWWGCHDGPCECFLGRFPFLRLARSTKHGCETTARFHDWKGRVIVTSILLGAWVLPSGQTVDSYHLSPKSAFAIRTCWKRVPRHAS